MCNALHSYPIPSGTKINSIMPTLNCPGDKIHVIMFILPLLCHCPITNYDILQSNFSVWRMCFHDGLAFCSVYVRARDVVSLHSTAERCITVSFDSSFAKCDLSVYVFSEASIYYWCTTFAWPISLTSATAMNVEETSYSVKVSSYITCTHQTLTHNVRTHEMH